MKFLLDLTRQAQIYPGLQQALGQQMYKGIFTFKLKHYNQLEWTEVISLFC